MTAPTSRGAVIWIVFLIISGVAIFELNECSHFSTRKPLEDSRGAGNMFNRETLRRISIGMSKKETYRILGTPIGDSSDRHAAAWRLGSEWLDEFEELRKSPEQEWWRSNCIGWYGTDSFIQVVFDHDDKVENGRLVSFAK